MVFNENPARLVQLTMSGSVGRSGINKGPDEFLVQQLLNAVAKADGGPVTPLAVDRRVGPKTIAAILRYQAANRLPSDGRMDLNGPTIVHHPIRMVDCLLVYLDSLALDRGGTRPPCVYRRQSTRGGGF